MQSVHKRVGAVFCAFGIILMLMAGLVFNVSATDDTPGTLTLTCSQNDFYLADMQWSIYKIGERRSNTFALTGIFSRYPVDLSKITDADKMAEAASTLNNFAVLDMIDPVQVKKTNGNGVVQFTDLEVGLYLAVGKKLKVGQYTYFPTPVIFEIDSGKNSTLNGYPKFLTKRTLPGVKDKFIVRKVWANADGQTDRPNTLRVAIYKDEEFYEEIQLSEENGWTYSWEGESGSDWRVKELSVPPGCYVMYRNNETQYIIMNAYDDMLLARTTTTTTVTTTATESISTETFTTMGSGDLSTATTRVSTDDYGENSRTTSNNSLTTTRVSTLVSGEGEHTTTTNPKDTKPGDNTLTTTDGGGSTDSNGSTITTSITSDNSTTKGGGGSSSKSTNGSGNGNGSGKTTTELKKLPQTGQLWWPVPLMLIGGLMFVAIGLRLLSDSRKED